MYYVYVDLCTTVVFASVYFVGVSLCLCECIGACLHSFYIQTHPCASFGELNYCRNLLVRLLSLAIPSRTYHVFLFLGSQTAHTMLRLSTAQNFSLLFRAQVNDLDGRSRAYSEMLAPVLVAFSAAHAGTRTCRGGKPRRRWGARDWETCVWNGTIVARSSPLAQASMLQYVAVGQGALGNSCEVFFCVLVS